MSDPAPPLRIRVQPSPRDADALRILLDVPVQAGARPATFCEPAQDAPLALALFAVPGVRRVEVDGASIHIRKAAGARWETLKAPIATAIRAVMARATPPLGEGRGAVDGDADMLVAVRALLDSRINPSIAGHGGQISAERVTDGTVYLRMSGGCQGCAASQLTLRGGVERTLRAALPDMRGVVDVTDHAAGNTPFYAGGSGIGKQPAGIVETPLADRVRGYLKALASSDAPFAVTANYGTVARALGLWRSGSVRQVTDALEDTMREDARAGRPFIAARAVSRATDGLPGKGFFDLARDLSRGPRAHETERAFHAREIDWLGSVSVADAPQDQPQGNQD